MDYGELEGKAFSSEIKLNIRGDCGTIALHFQELEKLELLEWSFIQVQHNPTIGVFG